MKVGDYVDYDATKSDANKTQNVDSTLLRYESPLGSGTSHGNGYGTQTYEATSATKWRVLSVSNDNVELISENVVTKKENSNSGNFVLNGAISYLYAEQELNEICKIYGYGYGVNPNAGGNYEIGGPKDTLITGKIAGTGARCITVEDVNKIAKVGETKDGINITTAFSDLDYRYGSTTNQTENDYYPTISTSSGKSSSKEAWNVKYTLYTYDKSKIADENMQNVIFTGNYWLSSRYVCTSGRYFGVRTLNSDSPYGAQVYYGYLFGDAAGSSYNYTYEACAIRPIVTLKSNVIDLSNTTDASGTDASHAWKLK